MTHSHHQHQHQHSHTHEPVPSKPAPSTWKLAVSATLHCLLGCGVGEVLGMIISTALHFSNTASIITAIILGFIGGMVLGIRPWLRAGLDFGKAFKQVLYVEGLSIAVMEAAQVLTEIYTPGVMQAHLHEPIFWIGMLLALIAGFLAALPVNYVLAKRGVRHAH